MKCHNKYPVIQSQVNKAGWIIALQDFFKGNKLPRKIKYQVIKQYICVDYI